MELLNSREIIKSKKNILNKKLYYSKEDLEQINNNLIIKYENDKDLNKKLNFNKLENEGKKAILENQLSKYVINESINLINTLKSENKILRNKIKSKNSEIKSIKVNKDYNKLNEFKILNLVYTKEIEKIEKLITIELKKHDKLNYLKTSYKNLKINFSEKQINEYFLDNKIEKLNLKIIKLKNIKNKKINLISDKIIKIDKNIQNNKDINNNKYNNIISETNDIILNLNKINKYLDMPTYNKCYDINDIITNKYMPGEDNISDNQIPISKVFIKIYFNKKKKLFNFINKINKNDLKNKRIVKYLTQLHLNEDDINLIINNANLFSNPSENNFNIQNYLLNIFDSVISKEQILIKTIKIYYKELVDQFKFKEIENYDKFINIIINNIKEINFRLFLNGLYYLYNRENEIDFNKIFNKT